MDASMNTVVHRFGIVRGSIVGSPPNISVTEGAAGLGPRSRGNLYVLVETLGGLPDPDRTVARLAEIVRDRYYQTPGSTTGAISAALRAANEWLFEENLNAPREQRGVAGVSCAVLRDGQLFLGQIGPALAYLLQEDGLRRFPEESPWLRQAIPSDAERAAWPPIGVRRLIEPQLYHASLQAGDTLVVASPSLARAASGATIAEALAQGPAQGARQLQNVARDRDMNVLIVGLEADSAVEAQPWPAATHHDEPALATEPPRARPRPAPTAPDLRPAAQAAGRALGAAAGGAADLLRRTLPEEKPRRGQAVRRAGKPLSSPGPSTRLLGALVLLIPVLIVGLVGITRWQFGRTRRAQVVDLLQQAQLVRAGMMSTNQPEVHRESLRQIVLLVDQALAIDPSDPTAVQMRQQAMDELDAASGVQRLYTLWALADLGTETADTLEPARIIVHGADIYLLDRSTDRAYHRLLNPAGDALEVPAPEVPLVQQGDATGAITVGELVDMVWMPAGGVRADTGLLVLERNGSLLESGPGDALRVLPVADSATWRKPQAAGAYAGNFYLLDPQQNRILKYLPTMEGYTDPPVDYLTGPEAVDLSGAVDMGIDGYIYVLLADGRICKFLSGERQSFEVTGLDEPMSNPVAIFVSGDDGTRGYIYVADAGLARVVQLTKQGEFIRQFRAVEGITRMDRVRGLYVDEATQRMYLVSGSTLYMAPLLQSAPVPPEAAEATAGQ